MNLDQTWFYKEADHASSYALCQSCRGPANDHRDGFDPVDRAGLQPVPRYHRRAVPGSGLVSQVLEGERSAINRLYARIIRDPRHKDVELLPLEEISERRFAKWSMAFVDISDRDPMIMMGHPEFDPYSAPGALVMTLVDELVAAGHDIKLPVL